jgi:beta-galactosidase
MGAEIRRAGASILGSTIKAKTAMLLSYETRFAFQIQPNNSQFTYYHHFLSLYRTLHRRNIPVEVVSPTTDLFGYKLVIAPAFHVVTEAEADNLRRFVENGGILLVTPRSGVKDPSNAVVNSPLPGLLSGVCGVEVADYDSLMPGMANEVRWHLPDRELPDAPVSLWCDILRPTTSQEIACYRQDFYAGKPAVTLNRYGQGQAIYAGVLGGDTFYEALAGWLLELAGIRPVMDTPKDVEVTERWQGRQRLLFVLNHSDREQSIELEETLTNLLDGSQIRAGKVTLPPREVLVLTKTT